MAGFLLDTNVVSETANPSPNAKVIAWLDSQPDILLYLSVISLGEMHKGVELLPPSARRDRLETFVAETIPGRFEDRILAVDAAVAKTWAELDASRQKIGRPLDMSDGLIAATAIHYDLTVVTRNTKDFSHLRGLHLLNPWE